MLSPYEKNYVKYSFIPFYIKKQEYLFVCMCLYKTEKPHVNLSPQQDVFM